MATTRDHVAAYDYETRRRVTSLVLGVDEAGRDPRRRLNRTLLGSLVIAVLVMAGFGIAGLLGGGGGPELPESGAVLVKGTGDRYVVVNGVLHPVLNLSSALLVGGGTLTEVRASALNGKPRGLPVGIPEAPDNLPKRLTNGPWTVCAVPSGSQVVPPTVEVLIGLPAPNQGRLGPDAGVVVDGGDASWLVTLGRRYRLTGNTRTVLGLQATRSMPVPVQVLDTLPEGPEIAIPAVTRGGAPAVPLPVRASVGDVIRTEVPGQPTAFFVVQPDGIRAITPLTATLLVAGGSGTVSADPAVLTNSPTSRQPAPDRPGWPKQVPTPLDPAHGQPLCVSTTPGAPPGDAPWAAVVSVPPELPAPNGTGPVVTGDLPGVTTSVALTPGAAALVLATTSAGQDGGFNLVTESGQRFPITSADAASRLHLDPAAAGRLPLPFVALLPSGPALDPEAAAREFRGSGPPDQAPNPGGGH
jgi:type VII secretion protein EccB